MEIADFLTALAIFCGGMTASFFFSGTEIGFYRVSKAKVVLEALLGSRRSRTLLQLVNHPPIFISTVLLGNNLANNFVSLGPFCFFRSFSRIHPRPCFRRWSRRRSFSFTENCFRKAFFC